MVFHEQRDLYKGRKLLQKRSAKFASTNVALCELNCGLPTSKIRKSLTKFWRSQIDKSSFLARRVYLVLPHSAFLAWLNTLLVSPAASPPVGDFLSVSVFSLPTGF